MRLVSFDGGFGRVENDVVVPMGTDVVRHLAAGDADERDPIRLDGLRLRAPVPRPPKIVAVGLNYRDHARGNEAGGAR